MFTILWAEDQREVLKRAFNRCYSKHSVFVDLLSWGWMKDSSLSHTPFVYCEQDVTNSALWSEAEDKRFGSQ